MRPFKRLKGLFPLAFPRAFLFMGSGECLSSLLGLGLTSTSRAASAAAVSCFFRASFSFVLVCLRGVWSLSGPAAVCPVIPNVSCKY